MYDEYYSKEIKIYFQKKTLMLLQIIKEYQFRILLILLMLNILGLKKILSFFFFKNTRRKKKIQNV